MFAFWGTANASLLMPFGVIGGLDGQGMAFFVGLVCLEVPMLWLARRVAYADEDAAPELLPRGEALVVVAPAHPVNVPGARPIDTHNPYAPPAVSRTEDTE